MRASLLLALGLLIGLALLVVLGWPKELAPAGVPGEGGTSQQTVQTSARPEQRSPISPLPPTAAASPTGGAPESSGSASGGTSVSPSENRAATLASLRNQFRSALSGPGGLRATIEEWRRLAASAEGAAHLAQWLRLVSLARRLDTFDEWAADTMGDVDWTTVSEALVALRRETSPPVQRLLQQLLHVASSGHSARGLPPLQLSTAGGRALALALQEEASADVAADLARLWYRTGDGGSEAASEVLRRLDSDGFGGRAPDVASWLLKIGSPDAVSRMTDSALARLASSESAASWNDAAKLVLGMLPEAPIAVRAKLLQAAAAGSWEHLAAAGSGQCPDGLLLAVTLAESPVAGGANSMEGLIGAAPELGAIVPPAYVQAARRGLVSRRAALDRVFGFTAKSDRATVDAGWRAVVGMCALGANPGGQAPTVEEAMSTFRQELDKRGLQAPYVYRNRTILRETLRMAIENAGK